MKFLGVLYTRFDFLLSNLEFQYSGEKNLALYFCVNNTFILNILMPVSFTQVKKLLIKSAVTQDDFDIL